MIAMDCIQYNVNRIKQLWKKFNFELHVQAKLSMQTVTITKNDISIHDILTVAGFIHTFSDTYMTIQYIPDIIRHKILFFYAKPIVMNIKYDYEIKHILFYPLHDTWYNIADKIQTTFNIVFIQSLNYSTHTNLNPINWNTYKWSENDLFIPQVFIHENDNLRQRIHTELNEISPQKQLDKLSIKIMTIASKFVDTEEKYVIILSSILRKASATYEYSKQYVDLCCYLQQHFSNICNNFVWLRSIDINETLCRKLFRKTIIRASERVFESYRPQNDLSCVAIDINATQKFLGAVKIIGLLYNKNLLHSNIIIKGILKTLLPPENKNPLAVGIEAACILLKMCGKQLDKNDKRHQFLLEYIEIIKQQMFCGKCEQRIQDMVEEVEKLKNKSWKST
eukprot:151204_1